MRGQIDFVDHQQITFCDARATFPRDFLTCSHINHVKCQVAQFRAEGRRQVIPSTFNENDVRVGKALKHAVNGFKVDGGVLSDRCVRAAPRLHTHDSFWGQGTADGQQALVFLGVDVVGDGHQVILVSHTLAKHL